MGGYLDVNRQLAIDHRCRPTFADPSTALLTPIPFGSGSAAKAKRPAHVGLAAHGARHEPTGHSCACVQLTTGYLVLLCPGGDMLDAKKSRSVRICCFPLLKSVRERCRTGAFKAWSIVISKTTSLLPLRHSAYAVTLHLPEAA